MNPITRRTFLAAGLAGGVALLSSDARGDTTDPCEMTLAEASEAVRAKKLDPVELTRACLKRIERHDKRLKAFITVTEKEALAAARERAAEVEKGKWRGPLHGIPVAVKDNIDAAGVRTTGGCAVLADRVPKDDAEVVRRLKEVGAVLVGKTNMSELAVGYDSVTSHRGPVANPWKDGHVAGGSSGGSAVAVAAGMCFVALGTDTGGSVRHPAACCGVVGLKATYGLVSIRGLLPLIPSLDHVGPLARGVADAALVLQAIAGPDDRDPASALDQPAADYRAALSKKTGELRLAKVKGAPFYDELHPDIEAAFDEAVMVLDKLTAGVGEAELQEREKAPLQALSRAEEFAGPWALVKGAAEKCHFKTREALSRGEKVTAAEYIEGRRHLELIRRRVRAVFARVDVLVTPATPVLPVTIEEAVAEAKKPSADRKPNPAGRNLAPFNSFGLPAIALPCGFSKSGLPIGVQLIAGPMREALLLSLAAAFERETAWHKRRPKLD
jgi:aspartyl-tRNA(Asn)/glutamyl-tRNA(Gln) amidotransferase subunit A